MRNLLEKLCAAFGPSGREEEVKNVIREAAAPYADEIKEDAMGNLIVIKKAKKENAEKLMIAAHMDQIGLIVTHIDENGFIRFAPMGGVSPHNALYRNVKFESGAQGVIGVENKKIDWGKLSLNQLFADIGASSKEEAEKYVRIGEIAAFTSPFVQTLSQYVSGALDNRAACAVVLEALKKVENNDLELQCVFTVQEELGLRGAGPAAFELAPDAALAVDVTLAGDTPECAVQTTVQGAGPCVKVKDRSVLCHPKMIAWMCDTAKENDIPYQMEVLTAGGTDAGAIHLTGAGIPTGALSLSCRYVHSCTESLNIDDMEKSVLLLKELMESSALPV